MSETEGANCKLYVLHGGLCMANNLEVFAEAESDIYKNRMKKLSITCFLIWHPKGWLLWDTGLPDYLLGKPEGLDVLGGALNFSVQKTLVSLLAEIGLKPLDIQYLTFSHMHYDHTGNSNLFAASTFLIDATEYESVFNTKAQKSPFYHFYSRLAESHTVKMTGVYDIFGDASVLTIPTPGHSPGHRSLYINLSEMGPVVISGDLYHFEEQRTYKRVPRINHNQEQTLMSMDFIEKFIVEKKARLIISHDFDQISLLPQSPDYVE